MRLAAAVITAALWGTAAMHAQATEIIGHRGASYDAPENTLPSVRLGYEQGADAVEIDIFLTQDGKIVAIHDADTKRVAGVDKKVGDQTLAEIQKLDAGSWKGPQWKDVRIPTLKEVLEAVPPGPRLVVEVKDEVRIVDELERVVKASGKQDQVVFIAFSYEVIQAVKKRMPENPAYWLYGFSKREDGLYGKLTLRDLVDRAKSAGLEGLDVNHTGVKTRELADGLHALGMRLIVYTVNDPKDARRMVELGVDSLTTDRPAYLREQLGL